MAESREVAKQREYETASARHLDSFATPFGPVTSTGVPPMSYVHAKRSIEPFVDATNKGKKTTGVMPSPKNFPRAASN